MIINGDALAVLKTMKTGSVHMSVTSSPYYGMRCYGTNPVIWGGDPNCNHDWVEVHPPGHRGSDTNPGPLQHEGNKNREKLTSASCSKCGAWKGELGLEPTPEMFVEHLTEIAHELKRVLRDDGTLYWNIGDGYASEAGKGGSGTPTGRNGRGEDYQRPQGMGNCKPKDLLEVPSMLAASLRAPYRKCNGCGHVAHDFKWGKTPAGRRICPKCEKSLGNEIVEEGWYLRARLPWIKRNALPSSVTDRPGSSIEYVLLLAKSGTTQFWTHPTFEGTRSQPEPDYIYRNKVTEEVVTIPPENWKTLTYVDGGKVKKLWRRINLWQGHDYYYDYVGTMQPSSDSYNKDKRPRGVIRQKVNENGKYPDSGQFERISSIKDLHEAGILAIPSGSGGAIILDSADVVAEKLRTPQKQDFQHPTSEGFNARYVDNGLGLRFMRDSDYFFKTWQGLLHNEDGEPMALVVNPKGYKGAHFACFPIRLVEPMIRASTSDYGVCPKCGAPWSRVVQKKEIAHDGNTESQYENGSNANRLALLRQKARESGEEYTASPITVGWSPTCSCYSQAKLDAETDHEDSWYLSHKDEIAMDIRLLKMEVDPAIVLDPFNGSGASGVAAELNGRKYIGIELNPDYCKLAEKRLEEKK